MTLTFQPNHPSQNIELKDVQIFSTLETHYFENNSC